MQRVRATEGMAPAVGPYSLAVTVNGLVFTSGQIGLTADGALAPGGVEAEVRQVMENLRTILQAAGVDFGSVVKSTIFLTNIGDFKLVNEIYASYFPENEYPVRETTCAASLPLGARVEISMIANAVAKA